MDLETVKKFFKLEVDEAVLLLVTITHPTFETIRVVNNSPAEDGSGDITKTDGTIYQAYPFLPELPNNTDELPSAKLAIANISYTDPQGNRRRVSDSIENISSSPLISFEIVTASNPDNVLMRFPRFELLNVTWDIIRVEGDLVQASYASEPYGFIRVIPSDFPAIYRS